MSVETYRHWMAMSYLGEGWTRRQALMLADIEVLLLERR